jgi:NAD(P)-dependent dehydrogenase (short-subunit alcohol dehydrogenase family)
LFVGIYIRSVNMSTAATEDRRVILVTGGNKGIGYEAVRLLSEQLPHASILLATRSMDNGRKAISTMQQQQQASSAAYSNIRLLELDVTDASSIQAAADVVQREYGRLDVLICNSGINRVGDDWQHADILAVNVQGVQAVVQAFLPSLLQSADACLIIVSSQVGAWTTHALTPALQKRLEDPATLSWADIESLAADYLSFAAGRQSQQQWPDARLTFGLYGVSKALISAWSRVLALQYAGKVRVAVVTPGLCRTDLSKTGTYGSDGQWNEFVKRTAEQGGASVCWPVTHPFVSGRFYLDGEELSYNHPRA